MGWEGYGGNIFDYSFYIRLLSGRSLIHPEDLAKNYRSQPVICHCPHCRCSGLPQMGFLEVKFLLVDEQNGFMGECRIVANLDYIYLTYSSLILVVYSAIMALLCRYCPRRNCGSQAPHKPVGHENNPYLCLSAQPTRRCT